MLKIQEFLLTKSFSNLLNDHGIHSRPSKDHSKWSLNYDQILAKTGASIANECRGLILRPCNKVLSDIAIVGPTEIVARPMDRFYNAGDPNAAAIDWETARILEKLDGTMCILYFDFVKNQWCVATRAVPEADVCFGDFVSSLKENTFYELFMHSAGATLRNLALNESEEIGPPYYGSMLEVWAQAPTVLDNWLTSLDKSFTYVFELTSPINRVVVKYDDYRITLLAARETATGHYLPADKLASIGVPLVEEWPLRNLAEIEAFLRDSDPSKIEGAVVVDAHNNRIKVKSAQWVLASRAKDMISMSKRNALTVIIGGSSDDVIPLLSEELQEYMSKLQTSLAEYCRQIDVAFNSYKLGSSDRKQFALFVQASGFWQTPFFNLYSGKWSTTLEWLRYLSVEKKLTDATLDVLLDKIK